MTSLDDVFGPFGDPPDPLASLPTDRVERALTFRTGLINHATGGVMNSSVYRHLRAELLNDSALAPLVPRFVRICQDEGDFWQFIKAEFSTYAERRTYLREAFAPLLEHLERGPSANTTLITDRLQTFDAGEVQRVWTKAISRCEQDPEGAVTSARTLLESVCMHVLDGIASPTPLYGPGDDLPKLYRMTSEQLNLAPSQHTEKVFKQLLGGCVTVVEAVGAIRNRLGDAHGRGRRPVKISPRHAHLVVNLSGAMALYLVETAAARGISAKVDTD